MRLHADDVLAGLAERRGHREPAVRRERRRFPAGRPRRVAAVVGICLELVRVKRHVALGAAEDDPRHAQPPGAVPAHQPQRRFVHRRDAVVARHRRQLQRRAHRHRPLQAALHAHGRRQVGPHLLVVVAEVADVELLQLRVGDVAGVERGVRLVGLAVDRQRPDDLPVAEVGRHVDPEDEAVAARLEQRRLPQVRPARLHAVVRADRDERFFVPVAVEVAEGQVERSVRALLPAVEGGGDVLAGAVHDLAAGLARAGRQQQRRRGRRDDARRPRARRVHSHLRLFVKRVSCRSASAAPARAPGAAPAPPRTAPR